MKNSEKLKEQNKKYKKIINITALLILLLIITFIIGVLINKQVRTLSIILVLVSSIGILISIGISRNYREKVEENLEKIERIETISQGIEDSK